MNGLDQCFSGGIPGVLGGGVLLFRLLDPIADLVTGFGGAWIAAAWQGGMALLLVWAVCRLWPGLAPEARCWLWRLAYLKLLLTLFCTASIGVPVVPTPVATPVDAGVTDGAVRSGAAQPMALAAGWFLLWLAGAGLVGLGIAREWRASRRLVRRARPVTEAHCLAAYAVAGRLFCLRRVPPLLAAEGVGSPVLTGVLRPVLLLPADLLGGCSDEEQIALLAHELAHLQRRDLLWAWLPALARVLFFIHPLVWWAGHEWRLAQEIACDAMAIRLTGTGPAAYGRAVLKVAARHSQRWAEPAVLGAAGASDDLRRRFLALQQRRPAGRRAGVLLATLATLLLLPWRLAAAPSAPAPPALPQPARRTGGRRPPSSSADRLSEEQHRLLALQRELMSLRVVNSDLSAMIVAQDRALRKAREHAGARQPPRASNGTAAVRASQLVKLRAEEAASQMQIQAAAAQQAALASQLRALGAQLQALRRRQTAGPSSGRTPAGQPGGRPARP